MYRSKMVDAAKGIAVICMIIFHVVYFPRICGYTEFNYNTPTMNMFARTAQIIFLTCVGINIHLSKKKKQNKEKNIRRILKLGSLALLMSCWTYLVFGNNYVKFGILHCITLVNLIFMYIDEPMWIIFSVFCIVLLHNNFRGNFSSNIPKPFGFILGLNSAYSSIDHFPLIPWILYPSLGIVIARSSDSFLFANSTLFPQFLQTLGKHSLDIYMIHWVVLYLVFCILYPGVRHLNIN